MLNVISGLKQRRPVSYLIAVILLCIISVSMIYGLGLHNPPIRSDGFGYYAYLPSVFIYHDITIDWLPKTDLRSLGDYPPFGGWTGLSIYRASGHYLNQFGIGMSIMSSPFFIIAHESAKLLGLKSNGYSTIYQLSAIVSGFFYFALGLILLYKFLIKYFENDLVLFALLTHVFGTGLFFYATLDSTAVPSHLYSFCLVSALMFLLANSNSKPLVISAISGFVIGMLFMVRNLNILFAFFFVLYDVKTLNDIRKSLFARVWMARMLVAGLVFSITIVPQLYYWKAITGHWIVYSYQNVGFNWLDPQFFNVLIGLRKGLFVYYPILLISVVGFFI